MSSEGRKALAKILPDRLRRFDAEKKAAEAYVQMKSDKSDTVSLATLLTRMNATIAGARAARETLKQFDKALLDAYEKNKRLELVNHLNFASWEPYWGSGEERGEDPLKKAKDESLALSSTNEGIGRIRRTLSSATLECSATSSILKLRPIPVPKFIFMESLLFVSQSIRLSRRNRNCYEGSIG